MLKHLLPFISLIFLTLFSPASAQEYHWYKGNTHAHTNRVDADASPEEVTRWHKEHGYSFLVISDHDILTDPSTLGGFVDRTFILIPGEEITNSFEKKNLHVNGINIRSRIEMPRGKNAVEVLQKSIDAVRAAGGVPQLNHPNRFYSFTDVEVSALKNVNLIEIYNMNKDSNNFGGGGHLSTEQIWDRLLTRGMVFYGIGSDDSHWFKKEFDSNKPHPGKAWVVVKAADLTANEITAALDKGDFYASNGVILDDVVVNDREYVVKIVEPKGKDFAFTTKFIGENGKVLAVVDGLCARYIYRGNEFYVRARVESSSGDFAITQPYFLMKKR